MAPSGKSRLAGRLGWRLWVREVADAGVANRRAGACVGGGGSLCASERRADRRARVGSDLSPPRVGSGLKLPRGHPCLAGAATARDLLHQRPAPQRAGSPGPRRARQPLPSRARASARDPAAAVTVAEPRLPPAPGSCRHPPAPLHAAPTGRAKGLLPGPRASATHQRPPRSWTLGGVGQFRVAPARDGPLGTCGRSGIRTWRGQGRRPPPRRAGRENRVSGGSFLSQSRSDRGGPDPLAQTGGTLAGDQLHPRPPAATSRLGAPVLAL